MEVPMPLLPLVHRFFETDPVAAAHSLETMEEEECALVLKVLPAPLLAEAFRYLQPQQAAVLLKDAPPELLESVVANLEPQQGAYILLSLPQETRTVFLDYLPEKAKREIQELLTYPENSAGRIMTTEFLAFHTEVKVRDAIQRIRTLANQKAPASYTYVVDRENHLEGVINMRDLLVASGEETLGSIMRKGVFAVDCFMDREEVANQLTKRRFFAVPVTDQEQRLLGIIKADQLLGDIQQEATEDIQKLFGAGGDERVFSPIAFSLRKRLPWLHVNLATAFLAAAVVGLFEGIIAKITVLAVFLPVVAGQGGNAGIQTLAVVMRGLVMREIAPHRVWPLLRKEAVIGILNGITIGVVTGAVAWLWHGKAALGVVIGLAMIVNLLAAGLAGAAIPLSMKAMGLDPAQSSGIVLTTVTDVVGFFSFLGFAVLFQSLLV
ncbi:MAG TPA: magnesium transporter [Candidatus Binatia bacterium]